MNYRKAFELVQHELYHEAPYRDSDFYSAVRTFLPLMQVAALLESVGKTPCVTAVIEETPP